MHRQKCSQPSLGPASTRKRTGARVIFCSVRRKRDGGSTSSAMKTYPREDAWGKAQTTNTAPSGPDQRRSKTRGVRSGLARRVRPEGGETRGGKTNAEDEQPGGDPGGDESVHRHLCYGPSMAWSRAWRRAVPVAVKGLGEWLRVLRIPCRPGGSYPTRPREKKSNLPAVSTGRDRVPTYSDDIATTMNP